MSDENTSEIKDSSETMSRNDFLRNLLLLLPVGLSYGTAAFMGLKYLFTGSRTKPITQKLFIALTEEVGPGQSYPFSTPAGEKFLLSNTGKGAFNYVAFSSVCPHLGCKVHWEAGKNRFYCPCHGGAFDISGKAIMGPPQKAGQSLRSCEVVVEGNAIYGIITVS